MSQSQTLEPLRPLRRFFKLLQPDRKEIFYIYIYAIFNGIIALALPLGIQAIIGLIAGGQISSSWMILAAIVTLGVALSGAIKLIQLRITESIQQRIFSRAAFDFAYRIPHLKIEKLRKEYVPELMNRFFDTLAIQKGITKILMDFSTSALEIIFGLILLSLYHPSFILFGFVLSMLLIAIFWLTGARGLQTSLKESKYKYQLVHWLEELGQTVNTFKLAGKSTLPFERVDDLLTSYLKSRKKHFNILLFQFSNIVAFKTIVTGGLLILGSILVVNNQINLGQFVASEIIIILIMAAAEKLILSMETIYDVLTGLEKIGAVTDLELESKGGMTFEEINNHKGISIKAEGLCYEVEELEKPILNNIEFNIKSGERICIAGYNSSGKSTLLHILTGLYENFTGMLTYNGIPRKNLDIESLREHIGNNSPVEDIFNGTLLENIKLGHEEVTMEDVLWATEKAGLTKFVQTQPEGFGITLQPRGQNLPSTIIKRIVLARSIVTRPLLLTMEDFLTRFDGAEKIRLIKFLTDRSHPWTLILISNDPEIAKCCDRVFVMKDGEVIDEGEYKKVSYYDCFDD